MSSNLAAAKVACEQARRFIGAGTDQQLLAQAKAVCISVTPFLSGQEGGNGSAELMLAVGKLIEQMRGYVELTIGLAHALMSFQIMVPAAISLAPGLIRGAMRAKTLVPQSSIPGMFILMLPWLYCPLVWCMYNIIFQLLGNLIMLMGLLLLAYGPMTYFVLGTLRAPAPRALFHSASTRPGAWPVFSTPCHPLPCTPSHASHCTPRHAPSLPFRPWCYTQACTST